MSTDSTSRPEQPDRDPAPDRDQPNDNLDDLELPPVPEPEDPDPDQEPEPPAPEPPDEPPHPAGDSAPVHNPETERALLAGLILNPDQAPEILTGLQPWCFFSKRHQTIYRALQHLHSEGQPPDLVLLVHRLRDWDRLDDAGGPGYVSGLLTGHARGANLQHYADAVQRDSRRRRILTDSTHLQAAVQNGDVDSTQRILAGMTQLLTAQASVQPITAQDVYSVDPEYPDWLVRDLIPRAGMVLFWARPGAGKTFLLLRVAHELLAEPQARELLGHPDLPITRNVSRVLWIATEETAGALRARADMVSLGLGKPALRGEILHIFASQAEAPVTILDLPRILEQYQPVDLVILDSLTGLRPKQLDGRPVKWDLDNDAANVLCLMLRGLAEHYKVAIVIVHHTSREEKGYRGPTDWWASADVMFGMEPEPMTRGILKVLPQKCRNGRQLREFRIRPEWGPDGFLVHYEGEAVDETAAALEEILRVVTDNGGQASQKQIIDETGLSRSAAQRAVKKLISEKRLRDTGNTAGRSPIFASEVPF